MVKQLIAIAALGTATTLAARPAAAQPAEPESPPTDAAEAPADANAPAPAGKGEAPAPPTAPPPAPAPPAPAPPAPAPPAPARPAPSTPPAPSAQTLSDLAEAPPEVGEHRLKPLLTTTGKPPTSQDLGSEADIIGAGENEEARTSSLNVWSLRLKGYVRAPMRISFGPRNDGTPGTQLHTPPRVVGGSSGKWDYAALSRNPSASLYLTYGNPIVSANLILSSNTLFDSGYPNLDHTGGIAQAYVTLKFPEAFGILGGLSVMTGAFSTRYGNAGPRGTSSGYYGTYLFGRTHVIGETTTANVDLTDRLQLIVEHGVGAKLEQVPFFFNSQGAPASEDYVNFPAGGPPANDFLPSNGKGPTGSTFVHHAHVGLILDDWLSVTGHYLTSWTPNDNSTIAGDRPEGRITVVGGEVHLDDDVLGNGYIGYSRVTGENLLALADGIQVIHGSDGRGLKEDYFGLKDRVANYTPDNAWGTIDTVLFQYLNGISSFIDQPLGLRDIKFAAYSMFNHARSPIRNPNDPLQQDIDRNMLKLGGELQFMLPQYATFGARVDRVMPDLSNMDNAYSAISPTVILYSKYKSREYIVIQYTHFFLGPKAYPASPYSTILKADPDMIMVAAIMSFKP